MIDNMKKKFAVQYERFATHTIRKVVPISKLGYNNYDDLPVEDVHLVMTQTGSNVQQAVRAIRNNNNDIVNAIAELTT
jgi:NACalpha-BTF3-like transcription factor